MTDERLKVLVACEESQRVCMEFRKLGHEAYSCDLLDCSGGHPEFHIKGDCVPLLDGRCSFTTMDGQEHSIGTKWSIICGFPPCTYFSTAGANSLFKGGVLNVERYNKGLKMKELFLRILNADCEHVLIENPTPMKIWNLPKCSQVIQPWMFGDNYTKRTCLWLKGLPNLIPEVTVKPENVIPYVNAGWTKMLPGKKRKFGVYHGSKERSKTQPGIARAIACTYSNHLTKEINHE